MAQLNFNARSVDPSVALDPIPAGWYNAAIDQSEMKPTNDGQGAYLEARYNILDGQFVGRKVFARFNLRNNNAQAVEIAYKQLSAVCHATGVLDCLDSNLLHGIPHKIKVSMRPGGPKLNREGQPTGENYEPSNEIKGWKNINEPTDTPVAAASVNNAGFPAQPPAQQAPAAWGAPAQAPVQQPAQQPWQQGAAAPTTAPGQPWGAPPAQQPMQQPMQQPAQQPAQQWQQQPAAQPTQQPGSQPWQQQPQQGPAPAQQPSQGAPAQPWQQQPGQPAQQPAQQPQGGGQSAPWAQGAPQGGNMGAPGAQPPWAR
jgi:hypothetical protein